MRSITESGKGWILEILDIHDDDDDDNHYHHYVFILYRNSLCYRTKLFITLFTKATAPYSVLVGSRSHRIRIPVALQHLIPEHSVFSSTEKDQV
jgi:hypothetical protein